MLLDHHKRQRRIRDLSVLLKDAHATARVIGPRQLLGEFVGSAALAMVVVGSGIAAQHLSPNDTGLELLENAVATGAGLFVLISVFAPISGAHFNPVVSAVDAGLGWMRWRDAAIYMATQTVGCVLGVMVANAMFARAVVTISTNQRSTAAHLLSEVVATCGLLVVIFALARTNRHALTAAAVGAYIGAAYFFTSSTRFANPAITVGRVFSNTFAGIAPSSVPAFIGAQAVGGALALLLVVYLVPDTRAR